VYQLGEIPFLKWRFYEADPTMLATALEAPLAHGVVLTQGRIATGSIFIDTAAKKAMTSTVWEPLGFPDACEMENAGVAQICKAYGVPYLSLRALSDVIEGDANADFGAFCQQAADNVFPIVQHLAATLVDAVDVSAGEGAKPKGGKPSAEEIEKMKAETAADEGDARGEGSQGGGEGEGQAAQDGDQGGRQEGRRDRGRCRDGRPRLLLHDHRVARGRPVAAAHGDAGDERRP
jgi:hypothetical protein